MGDARAQLWLIRHAESEWNSNGRWQGQGDPPLSPRGREQAKQLARDLSSALRDAGVSHVYCSDLRRARETAEAVAAELGLDVRVDSELRELDIGAWSGLNRDQIEERDPDLLRRFEANDPDVRAGGGESRRQIRERARRAIQRISRGHVGECIVVVTHLGFVRALIPGSDPGNAEWIRVGAREALRHREAEFAEPLPPGAQSRV